MKASVNKKTFYIMMVALGAALIVAAILLNIYSGEEWKRVGGVSIGLGAALVSIFSAHLYNLYTAAKHPETYRKKTIEVNDERNTAIRDKAWAKANNLFIWILVATIFVFILLDAELYVTGTLAGLVVVNSILFGVFYDYFSKRL
jgi:Ca2+/H+ antiporter